MSEQKPEYKVFAQSDDDIATARLNRLAAEGYEYVGQSTGVFPVGEPPFWTVYTVRLRPEIRDNLTQFGLAEGLASRLLALEKRLAELETLTSQQKLRALEEHKYVSGLMVDLRALQTAEKDDRKAICDHDYKLSVLEREVKHLRANLEANILRVDRLVAIQKATEEMAQSDGTSAPKSTRSLFAQINELDTLTRRLASRLDHAWWFDAEINGMKCCVLVSARTEETGHE